MSASKCVGQHRVSFWFSRNSSCFRCVRNFCKRNFCQTPNAITESIEHVKEEFDGTDVDYSSKLDSKSDASGGKSDEENKKHAKQNTFGYLQGKRDKGNDSFLYLNMISLPKDLKESLAIFYKKFPAKVLTADGQQLARYLRNRGRPTDRSWKKYKQDKKINKQSEQSSETTIEKDMEESEETSSQMLDEENLDILDSEEKKDSRLRRDLKTQARKPSKASYTVLRYGRRETAAFAASRIPSCYGATLRALSEIKKREPNFQPKSMLDFGSGTGSAIWAANELWRNSLKEYQCVDISEEANKACEFLLRGGEGISRPLKIPGVYFRKFLPLSNKVTYDVVVSAYTLSEMAFRKQRQAAIASLWGKTNDFLVIIEPGNNEGFDIALQARNHVTKQNDGVSDAFAGYVADEEEILKGLEDENEFEFSLEEDVDPGYVFAPCPHDVSCPRSEVDSRDHPCNFEQKVQLSFSQRNSPLKRWGYATERFSYLILRKGERKSDANSMSRVLHDPKRKRRHVICDICVSNGTIERHVITKKKDPELYKGVRHCLKWGDLMPEMGSNKKPMKVIKLENTDKQNKD